MQLDGWTFLPITANVTSCGEEDWDKGLFFHPTYCKHQKASVNNWLVQNVLYCVEFNLNWIEKSKRSHDKSKLEVNSFQREQNKPE